jgi:hypothetical protein
MVQKFTTNCDFNGSKAPVTLYIGNPAAGSHPLAFQNKWLGKEKGGNVPAEIMESFLKLRELSEKSRVSFEELCKYVVEELQANNSIQADFNKASELSSSPKKDAKE